MFLLNMIDEDLFYKLRQILLNCNYNELLFIEQNDIDKHYKNNMMIFSLKTLGLIEQAGNDDYIFTTLAKALKSSSLSGDDLLKQPIKYSELIAPRGIQTMTEDDVMSMFDDVTIQSKL